MSASEPAPGASLLLYCRAGFEDECAKEIVAVCRAQRIDGHVRARPDAGWVEFVALDALAAPALRERIHWRQLVFARQLVHVAGWQRALPTGNRVAALMPAIARAGGPFSALWLETADTNEAKELSAFCRKFQGPLAAALEREGLLDERSGANGAPPADGGGTQSRPRLHVFFTGSSTACVGISMPGDASGWPMGIPRLRMPGAAPSRSTLKLAEALLHWFPEGRDRTALHEGVTAVDLGASPGGWTWQLVRRGVQVTAVDNGAMDARLIATGLVDHVRGDGFRYRPPTPVHWMVCDIVEQPRRIAALVGDWLARGWCAHCIFNLKLPMKQRLAELERCRALLGERCAAGGARCHVEFRHLYHDREEVTGYAVRGSRSRPAGVVRNQAARPTKRDR